MHASSRQPLLMAALGLLLLLAACGREAPVAASQSSPQEFLAALYGHYEGEGPGAGIDYSNGAELRRWFTPDLAQGIEADFAAAQAAGEPPALNGDPFVGAQEWDVGKVDIAIAKSAGADETMASVRIDSLGRQSEFKLDLRRTGAGWRIADIDWGYDRLSAVVAP